MKKSMIEYKIKQKDTLLEYEEYCDKFDISSFKGMLNYRNTTQEIEDDVNQIAGNIVVEYQKQLEKDLQIEILRDSYAEKYIKLKPYKYEYSTVFNFYECIDKQDVAYGTIATKGDILAELIINIIFE